MIRSSMLGNLFDGMTQGFNRFQGYSPMACHSVPSSDAIKEEISTAKQEPIAQASVTPSSSWNLKNLKENLSWKKVSMLAIPTFLIGMSFLYFTKSASTSCFSGSPVRWNPQCTQLDFINAFRERPYKVLIELGLRDIFPKEWAGDRNFLLEAAKIDDRILKRAKPELQDELCLDIVKFLGERAVKLDCVADRLNNLEFFEKIKPMNSYVYEINQRRLEILNKTKNDIPLESVARIPSVEDYLRRYSNP